MSWWKRMTGAASPQDLLQPAASSLCKSQGEWDEERLPKHIAIIMDGNGRWATERGLLRSGGHKAGIAALKRTVEACHNLGIPYLTVYAFSTENWRRPASEVRFLLQLLIEGLRTELDELLENGVRVRVIGEISGLPQEVQAAAVEAVQRTASNTGLQLQIALNYGGRAEIAAACRQACADVLAGKVELEELTEEVFAGYLFTRGIPDPDLIVRTGGEMRLSNFLLWQSAYAELFVTDLFWPDFDADALQEAIDFYVHRERRFGGLGAKKGS